MTQPSRRPSGVFQFNVRVPVDLVEKVRGTRIVLPLDGGFVTVTASDKVMLSLRTKEKGVAIERCAPAFAALCQHFAALRAGPKPLNLRQIVALAGEAYCDRTNRYDDPDLDAAKASAFERRDDFESWKHGDAEDPGEISDAAARLFEAISRPWGPQLLAFQLGGDIDERPYVTMTYRQAIIDLFGAEAHRLLGRHQIVTDAASWFKLVEQIAKAVHLAGDRFAQIADGDFTPDDNLRRFPAYEPAGNEATNAALARANAAFPSGNAALPHRQSQRFSGPKVTVETLFKRYTTFNAPYLRPSTLRRYQPSIASLAAFMGERDVRTLTPRDFAAWADHRRDRDGIAAKTVNANDLVAASSLFTFAASHESDLSSDGEKVALCRDNPVCKVRLKVPPAQTTREKKFRIAEASAILLMAREVRLGGKAPKAAACRRFAPFICAYSGARIQEVCWLTRADIRDEGGIFVMRFSHTKTGVARTVPLHPALIEEGLLEYWHGAGPGLLFAGDVVQASDASRPAAEQRASEMAAWISKKLTFESGASPNHGWRHLFITIAQSSKVGIPREKACAIAGHNQSYDAHGVYEQFPVEDLYAEICKFPLYRI